MQLLVDSCVKMKVCKHGCDVLDLCVFLVFTSHVIKTKNQNHSIMKVKNLADDK